jgi:hypothetical protein
VCRDSRRQAELARQQRQRAEKARQKALREQAVASTAAKASQAAKSASWRGQARGVLSSAMVALITGLVSALISSSLAAAGAITMTGAILMLAAAWVIVVGTIFLFSTQPKLFKTTSAVFITIILGGIVPVDERLFVVSLKEVHDLRTQEMPFALEYVFGISEK